MTAPARAARRAAVHVCVDCLALPEFVDDQLGRLGQSVGVEYRPRTPRPTTGGPRSQRCATHARARRDAARAAARARHKLREFGLTPALQAALWTFQGGRCPSGAKVADELPAGVATDHNHDLAAAVCSHDPAVGCPRCVTGFLSAWVNTDVVGRLTALVGRDQVSTALRAIADHLDDPPLARLLAQRPDLLTTPDPTGVAA